MNAGSLVFTALHPSTAPRRLIAIFITALFVFGVLVVDAQLSEGGRGGSKVSQSRGHVYTKGQARMNEAYVQPQIRAGPNSSKTRLIIAVLLASATPSR